LQLRKRSFKPKGMEQQQNQGLLNSLLGDYETEVVHTVNLPLNTAIVAVLIILAWYSLGALFGAFRKK
jgi:hypothetical protein